MRDTLHDVLQQLIPCSSESKLCERIDAALDSAGIEYEREYAVTKDRRLDYYIPQIKAGIEVKTSGSALAVNRQCLRYLEHQDVDSVYLVTRKALNLPSTEYTCPGGQTKFIHTIELWRNSL